MFVNLLIKEFKNMMDSKSLNKKNVLSVILSCLISISFIVIEVYIYQKINQKLMKIENASNAFLTIFLFGLSIINILYLTSITRKTLYTKLDSQILINKPVPMNLNMLAKIVFIYIKDVINNLLISFPILICYALSIHGNSRILFIMSLYPLLIPLFETGISFLLSFLYQGAYIFFKKYFVIKTIINLIF